MAGNGSSQTIPPTITRVITKDILNGNPQVKLAWIVNVESPANPTAKIAKMLYRFDADDNPDAVEVYCIGMIENRAVGVRTTIRIADVDCIDEVMDIAAWTDEIKAAEAEGEDEPSGELPDDPEDPPVEEPKPKKVAPAPAETAAALPSSTTTTQSS
jgi:hypothetical protein